MNNNNSRQPNNSNRRRGRNNNNNNNRQQQNNRSGFDYNNSIDNRARGNASQMLEKYKKLASDAQFNDDRVNAEYHLQFADHYFRVLADFRSRQEARQDQGERRPRDDAREDRDDWQNEDRSASYDEQGSNENSYSEAETADAASNNADNNNSEERRPQRDNRPRRNDRGDRPERGANDRNAGRGPRRHHSEDPVDEPVGLDIAVLPPSIAIANDFDDVETEPKPVRKPRARRPKTANDEGMVAAAE